MSTVLVINSVKRNSWSRMAFSKGDTVTDRISRYLTSWSEMPVIELIPPGEEAFIEGAVTRETGDSCSSLIEAFGEIFKDHSRLVYFWADTPFLDKELSEELIAHHNKYLSQYTFSDGWPLGLTPEILENTAQDKLEILARGDESPIKRDSLFTLIQKDINAFDLETLVSPEDFRLLRLELAADSKRNCLLLDRLDEAGLTTGKALAKELPARQELLRTLPAFFQFQITGKRPQKTSYLPNPDFPEGKENLSREDFGIMLDKVRDFSADGVISLSYWGEPSSHPQVYDFISDVLKKKNFRLLLETCGLGWDREALLPLIKEFGERIIWIVELDALDPVLYGKLRGDGQEEALGFIDFLGENTPDSLYVQTTRMGENEDYLETLYQEWKEKPGKLIIKKYDHFCGTLPCRKVTELAPWERNPCWHLKRDMVVLLDGTVPVCQERLDKKIILGNLITEEIETVWERGREYYSAHLGKDYPSFCGKCDEYYTYNF